MIRPPHIPTCGTEQQDVGLHTAGYLPQQAQEQVSDYYSLGEFENYEQLSARNDVRLRAFEIFEPPVVAHSLCWALPKLTAVNGKDIRLSVCWQCMKNHGNVWYGIL